MTQPGISIPITADGGDFDDELRRIVVDAMRDVQLHLDSHPLEVRVGVDIDAAAITRQIDTALSTATAGQTVDIDATVDLDFEQLFQDLADVETLFRADPVDIQGRLNVDTDFDAGLLAAEINTRVRDGGFSRVRIPVEPDFTEFPRQVNRALRSMQSLFGWSLAIPVDIDAAGALAQFRALRAALEAEARPIDQRVNVDVDRGILSRAGDLTSSLDDLGKVVGYTTAISAGIAAIGGAAGAAVGAVGGLAVGLAALGPAAGAILGTAVVAVQGLGDAFKAAAAEAENGPKEAAAQAKAVQAAQDGVRSALDGVTSAQKSARSASKDLAAANQDLEQAYKDAREEAEDFQFTIRGTALDQKEALRDLRKAQLELNKALTPDERIDALIRLERAQLRYDQAVEKGGDVQAQAAEMAEKGIDGSDRVVSARERQTAAAERVAEADAQVAKAHEQVTRAQQALTAAQAAGTPSAEKLAQALAKLAPSARELVTTAREIKPLWDEVADSVQQTTFEGWSDELRGLVANVLPTVGTGMNLVAEQINGAGKQFSQFLQSAQGVEGLRSAFAGAANLLEGMRSSAGGFATGMIDLTTTVEPHLFGIGQAFANIGGEIGKAFTAAKATGELSSLFDGFTATLRGAGPLLGSLVSSLITVGDRVLPALEPLLVALGDALVDIAPELGDLGAEFSRSLALVLPDLAEFVRLFAVGLRPVLPVVGQLLSALLGAAAPLIEPLSQIAQSVGSALVDAIVALEPSIGPLGQALADLVTAAAPLVPLFAESISVALQALSPALSDIARALAPVVSQFASEMLPVLRDLAPILAETARIVGVALADAIRQIQPSIPELVGAFGDLLLAVAPLLPEIARMAAEVLPPLIDVLVQLTPVIVDAIDAFTWLVEQTLPILITAIQGAAAHWADQFGAMADVVSWLTGTVFPSIGAAIDQVKGWFDIGVDAIAAKWDQLREAGARPIRFLVNTVWNDGLLKAWNAVSGFLPGIVKMEPITLGFRTGGAVFGPGTGTSDSIPAMLSNDEHVVTAAEVIRAGGHNIWYAIRDMIMRGIPFSWDNGKIISDLGRGNLDAYGAAVAAKGFGNVSPEGLFDQLLPRFRDGGAVTIEPWMRQLLAGHEFARAQHGRPYQWAGPRFIGDSFDCSGFMGSIAAAILGLNPWQRYWATSSFAGYPSVGPQGFTRGALDGGMVIGVTDDPGGPGGGHTAGVLGALPLLGISSPMRVESGGALGDVHYGMGTDPTSFAATYGLPIGANGFFQPGVGGGSVGPTPSDQRGFLERQIDRVFREITDPIRGEIEARVGPPPPEWRRIPPEFLTTVHDKSVQHLAGLVGGLGDLLPSAWQKAQDLAEDAFRALTPFDSGGLASGTGFMPKNIISPERVLSPEQTRLFEALVMSLQQIAGTGTGASAAPELLTATIFEQGIDFLAQAMGKQPAVDGAPIAAAAEQMERTQAAADETGKLLADTRELVQRSESSQELVVQEQTEQLYAVLDQIEARLTEAALVPIMQSAVAAGIDVLRDWLKAGFGQVTNGTDRTTRAVENLDLKSEGGGTAPFGAPGSAFDATKAISDAVVSVANTATAAFNKVAQDVANAALAQKPSRVGNSKGVLGRDISGGPLVDLIVKLTGVEIEIRDNLLDTLAEIQEMRGDLTQAFDSSGRIVADTAELMQRNESSRELVISEMARLNRELMKAVLRYLVLSVLLPILTAILGVMIQLAVTAIGAAIGSIIPGIGTLIGAAIGAVVGAALAGAAAVFTGLLAVGAGAAIDSFDSGGIAMGKGLMVKDTLAPERVLSPRQTESFDRLVAALEGQRGNRNINAPITVYSGPGAGQDIQNRLLSLL